MELAGRFACSVCSLRFSSNQQFDVHQCPTGQTITTCTCRMDFHSRTEFADHFAFMHVNGGNQCLVCMELVLPTEQLEHWNSHGEDRHIGRCLIVLGPAAGNAHQPSQQPGPSNPAQPVEPARKKARQVNAKKMQAAAKVEAGHTAWSAMMQNASGSVPYAQGAMLYPPAAFNPIVYPNMTPQQYQQHQQQQHMMMMWNHQQRLQMRFMKQACMQPHQLQLQQQYQQMLQQPAEVAAMLPVPIAATDGQIPATAFAMSSLLLNPSSSTMTSTAAAPTAMTPSTLRLKSSPTSSTATSSVLPPVTVSTTPSAPSTSALTPSTTPTTEADVSPSTLPHPMQAPSTTTPSGASASSLLTPSTTPEASVASGLLPGVSAPTATKISLPAAISPIFRPPIIPGISAPAAAEEEPARPPAFSTPSPPPPSYPNAEPFFKEIKAEPADGLDEPVPGPSFIVLERPIKEEPADAAAAAPLPAALVELCSSLLQTQQLDEKALVDRFAEFVQQQQQAATAVKEEAAASSSQPAAAASPGDELRSDDAEMTEAVLLDMPVLPRADIEDMPALQRADNDEQEDHPADGSDLLHCSGTASIAGGSGEEENMEVEAGPSTSHAARTKPLPPPEEARKDVILLNPVATTTVVATVPWPQYQSTSFDCNLEEETDDEEAVDEIEQHHQPEEMSPSIKARAVGVRTKRDPLVKIKKELEINMVDGEVAFESDNNGVHTRRSGLVKREMDGGEMIDHPEVNIERSRRRGRVKREEEDREAEVMIVQPRRSLRVKKEEEQEEEEEDVQPTRRSFLLGKRRSSRVKLEPSEAGSSVGNEHSDFLSALSPSPVCPKCGESVGNSVAARKEHYRKIHYEIVFKLDPPSGDIERWVSKRFGAPGTDDRICRECNDSNDLHAGRIALLKHVRQAHREGFKRVKEQYRLYSREKGRRFEDYEAHKLLT